ncbi:MAG: NAD(P)-dependent oxidoreductase [candidate division WOR-3 bacterium]
MAVTGATGCVGRAVINELLKREINTIAIIRKNPERLRESPFLKTIIFDISKPSEKLFDLFGRPDVLIHLAWDGLPNYNSLHHFEVELPNQYRFLKNLIEDGLKHLLITGTCFEYGMQNGLLHENIPTMPSTPYGFAKDALRRSLEFLKKYHTFSLTWARIFYIYGDGQSESSLYSQLLNAIKSGQKYFNMSKGDQIRDYLPVEKAAEYLVELAIKKKDLGIVNVCSGKPVSVRSLVESWIKEMKEEINLNLGFYPYPEYEPMAFWGSNEKLNKILSESK